MEGRPADRFVLHIAVKPIIQFRIESTVSTKRNVSVINSRNLSPELRHIAHARLTPVAET